MPKTAISITLRDDNLTWLRGRVRADQARSVSDVLDRLVSEARTRGTGGHVRSVVGTIDAEPSDPLLLRADEAIRALFTQSTGRPLVVQDERASYGRPSRKRPRRV